MADTRLTLRQAAAVLGVSESAIRKRVERGTLRSDKGPDGRRYVYLDTVADNMAIEGEDTSATHEHDALMSELRAHNDTLREQLEVERQAHAEARRIIARLVERIPAIETLQEARESPETVKEKPERPAPRWDAPGFREGADTAAPNAFRALALGGYVLGIIISGTTEFLLISSFHAVFRPMYGGFLSEDVLTMAAVVLPLLIPIVFGLWVGRNYKGTNLWARLGATVALIIAANLVLSRVLLDIFVVARGGSASFPELMPTIWLWPVNIAFLSSALIGNASRRRAAGPTSGAGFASKLWSPLGLTLIGTAGNILAATITGIFALVGT